MSIDANAINGYPRGIDLFEVNVNFGFLLKTVAAVSFGWRNNGRFETNGPLDQANRISGGHSTRVT